MISLVLAVIWFNSDFQAIENDFDEPVADDYVLAVSWQPAFCEQRPNVSECRSQRTGRFDAKNFSLHGLWPQPASSVYCGVNGKLVSIDKSGRWHKLPKLGLSEVLRKELSEKMPGYRSKLHRHEWYKHGSCLQGVSAETYFRKSLDLLDALNTSQLTALMRVNGGKKLSFRDVERAFVKSFGNAARERLIMDCYRDDGRRIIHEFKLSLGGELSENPNLADMLTNGKKVGKSCPSGIVDVVGNQ